MSAINSATLLVLDEAHRATERLPRSKVTLIEAIDAISPPYRIVIAPSERNGPEGEIENKLSSFAKAEKNLGDSGGSDGSVRTCLTLKRSYLEIETALLEAGVATRWIELPVSLSTEQEELLEGTSLTAGDTLLVQIHPACLEENRRSSLKQKKKRKNPESDVKETPLPHAAPPLKGTVTTAGPLNWSFTRSGRMNQLIGLVRDAQAKRERMVVYCRLVASMDAIEESLKWANSEHAIEESLKWGANSEHAAEDKITSLEWIRVDEFKRQQAKRRKTLDPVKSGLGWSLCIHAVKAVDDFVMLPSDVTRVLLFDEEKSLSVQKGRFSVECILAGVMNLKHDAKEVSVYSYGPC